MAGLRLPPGFRFHPTDQELVEYYLKEKIEKRLGTDCVIEDVDLLSHEPWDLPSLSSLNEGEWYFFCPRDRKYPNGSRANRATEKGYWKATGKDKQVLASKKGKRQSGSRAPQVGMKKTLVFYQGRAPHGSRTDWVMHEYRLETDGSSSRLRQGDYVLCRIFNKSVAAAEDSDLSPTLRSVPAAVAEVEDLQLPALGAVKGEMEATGDGMSFLEDECVSPETTDGLGLEVGMGGGLAEPSMDVGGVWTDFRADSSHLVPVTSGSAGPAEVQELFAGVGTLTEEEQEFLDEFFPPQNELPHADVDVLLPSEPWASVLEAVSDVEGVTEVDQSPSTVSAAAGFSVSLPGWDAGPSQVLDLERAPGGNELRFDNGNSGVDDMGFGLSERGLDAGIAAVSLEGLLDREDGATPNFEEVSRLADELADELDAAEQQLAREGMGGGESAIAASGGDPGAPGASAVVMGSRSLRSEDGGTLTVSSSRRSLEDDLRHVLRAHGVVVDQSDLASPSMLAPSMPQRIRPRARALPRGPHSHQLRVPVPQASGTAAGLNRMRLQVMAAPQLTTELSAPGFLPEFQEALARDSELSLTHGGLWEPWDDDPHDAAGHMADGEAAWGGAWEETEEPSASRVARRIVVGGRGRRTGVSVQRVGPEHAQGHSRLVDLSSRSEDSFPEGLSAPGQVEGRVVQRVSHSHPLVSSVAHASPHARSFAPASRMKPTPSPHLAQFVDDSSGSECRHIVQQESCARARPLADAVVGSRTLVTQNRGSVQGAVPAYTAAKIGRSPTGVLQERRIGHKPVASAISQSLQWMLEKLPVLPASAAEMPRRKSETDVHAMKQLQDGWAASKAGLAGEETQFGLVCQGMEEEQVGLPLNFATHGMKRPLFGPAPPLTVRSLIASFLTPVASWGPVDWMIVGALASHMLTSAGRFLSAWWSQ